MPVNRVNEPSSRGVNRPDSNQGQSAINNEAKRELSGKSNVGLPAAEPVDPTIAPLEASMEKADERRALLTAVDDLNRATEIFDRRFEFRVHEATNRIIIEIYDRETDELIREVPPEKILDAVVKMQELLGLLFDERA